MARQVFYSFHYEPDNWRAAQVRNMGVVEGNKPCADNDWERIKRNGDGAIERWIDGQLDGKSCCIVLIGENTAGRKWIKYEIEQAWERGKGLLGIYIHGLKNRHGYQSNQGRNPFNDFTVNVEFHNYALSTVVRAYDPPYQSSKNVYDYIHDGLKDWIEDAISIRNKFR
jgi:hypothetical protein